MLGLGSGINRLSAAEAAAIAGRIPGFTGLLDESYGSGAAAAYSVRQLSSSETTAMVIRRDSDNQETSIGFDSNGNLDETAIETFCSGTTCKVSEWRDQSGNRNHAVQTTAANQPTIYTGGAIVKENGRVAFNSTSGASGLSAAVNGASAAYLFTVASSQNSHTRMILASSGSAFVLPAQDSSSNTADSSGTTINGVYLGGSSYSYSTWGQMFDDTTNRQLVTTDVNNSSWTTLDFGWASSSIWGMYQMQEAIFYTSDKSTDRTSIESNIGDYFTQNTPLLDTYTGAAAAYSLRKLSSSYSGAAIRVRRDNDNLETDINFNVFGELDTVSLAAHCGSSNGFVTKWYSQAGSNDAAQSTAANQPKIYDSVTGVVTQNGKPAVQFDGSNDHLLPSQGSSYNVGTLFGVHDNNASSSRVGAQDYLENSFWLDTTTQMYFRNRGGTITINNTDQFKNWYFLINGTDTSEAAINGATATTSTFVNLGVQDRIGIGRNQGSYFNGYFYELILYKSDQSANRTGIEDNINTFYSIY